MMTGVGAVEASLIDLFQHLGIDRAHIAAGRLQRSDWHGLTLRYPERVASLTLMSPPAMDGRELQAVASRLLVIAGDQGAPATSVRHLLAILPKATSQILHGYTSLPWSDVAVERGAEIAAAMLDFLGRIEQSRSSLPELQGEVAGISYRIRGAGPPLVLMPPSLLCRITAQSVPSRSSGVVQLGRIDEPKEERRNEDLLVQ
jgi:pimeloyl-ACP methyl ester carboxylesterase